MGATVCRAVQADPELELVAAVDPHHSGLDLGQVAGADVPGVQVAATADALERAGAEVAVGTTGFTEDDLAELRRLFPEGGRANCVVAPNFAIGAVLMIRFAELAAPWFETAEIIELHHDGKVDAPSGTAMLTANRMAAASSEWGSDPTKIEVVQGARGGAGPAGLRIHSVRLRGVVAHQEVLLGTTGQSLTLRHDSYDRSSFMPGVLLAVKAVASRPGLTVGLDQLLGV
jgi:4-hydroxy-tetrahydrodipicolinate reductase